MVSRAPLVAMVVAGAFLATTLGVANTGPLRLCDGAATACAPKSGYRDFVLGDDILVNDSDRPVVIDRVRLTHPEHLTLTGARVVTVSSHGRRTLLGTLPGPPLQGAIESQMSAFDRSEPAAGTAVEPTRSGTDQNLLVEVRSDTVTTLDRTGLAVDYRQGIRHYSWHSIIAYVLSPRGCDRARP